MAREYPNVNSNLINPNFDSYKLGRVLGDPVATRFDQDILPVQPEENASFHSLSAKLKTNHLCYLGEENVYVFDRNGVLRYPSLDRIIRFPDLDSGRGLSLVSTAVPSTLGKSPYLILSHGDGQMTVIDPSQDHRILFSHQIPLVLDSHHSLQQPFTVEAAVLKADGSILCLLSSFQDRIILPDNTLSHPIVFEQAHDQESLPVLEGGLSSGHHTEHTSRHTVGAPVTPATNVVTRHTEVTFYFWLVRLAPAGENGNLQISGVGYPIQGKAAPLQVIFNEDASSVFFVGTCGYGASAESKVESMEVETPMSREIKVADNRLMDDDNDVDPELLAQFTSDKPATGMENLVSYAAEIPEQDEEEEEDTSTNLFRFAVENFSLGFVERQKIRHMSPLCSTIVTEPRQYPLLNLGLKYDVDMCVFQLRTEEKQNDRSFVLGHVDTFPALGYVSAGKRHKKYFLMTPDKRFAVISEFQGYMFVYQHATARDFFASQQIVHLSETSFYGMCATNRGIYVLTQNAILFYPFL